MPRKAVKDRNKSVYSLNSRMLVIIKRVIIVYVILSDGYSFFVTNLLKFGFLAIEKR